MKKIILIAGASLALATASPAQLYNYWIEAEIEDAINEAREDNEEATRQAILEAQEENKAAIQSLQDEIERIEFERE